MTIVCLLKVFDVHTKVLKLEMYYQRRRSEPKGGVTSFKSAPASMCVVCVGGGGGGKLLKRSKSRGQASGKGKE